MLNEASSEIVFSDVERLSFLGADARTNTDSISRRPQSGHLTNLLRYG